MMSHSKTQVSMVPTSKMIYIIDQKLKITSKVHQKVDQKSQNLTQKYSIISTKKRHKLSEKIITKI